MSDKIPNMDYDADEVINEFKEKQGIQLDPIYTGKMMQTIFESAEKGFFPKGAKILAFHTGGLQGVKGANLLLKSKGRIQIIEYPQYCHSVGI